MERYYLYLMGMLFISFACSTQTYPRSHNEAKISSVKSMPSEAAYAAVKNSSPHVKILGEKLLQSLHSVDDEEFHTVILEAMRTYAHDQAAFDAIMDTRDAFGHTPLMHLVIYGDIDHIIFFLDKIKEFYANDIHKIFDILNAKDAKGRTALWLSTIVFNYKSFTVFLDKATDLLRSHKELFLSFIKAPDTVYGWGPLTNIVYNSSYQDMVYLIEKAQEVLGKSSAHFNEFINATDFLGMNAIDSALSPQDKTFLRLHGAKETPLKPIIIESRAKGIDFLKLLSEGDYAKAKNMLQNTLKLYKTDSRALLEFLEIKDDDGWSPVMHIVAANKYDFLEFFVTALDPIFVQQPEYFFWIFNDVDINGINVLNLAITRRYFECALYIIKVALQYAEQKDLFFQFINEHDAVTGATPLINAAYQASDNNSKWVTLIKALVNAAQSVYGAHSREFMLFINAKDFNDTPALGYIVKSSTPELLHFLQIQGAYKSNTAETGIIKAPETMASHLREHELAPHLLQSVDDLSQSNNSGNFRKILTQARKTFRNDHQGFLKFITTREDEQWPPLIGLIARGDYANARYLINFAQQMLQHDQKSLITFLTTADDKNRTALYYAAVRNKPDLIALILNAAADFFDTDKAGYTSFVNTYDVSTQRTALLVAVMHSENEVLYVLVPKVADFLGVDSEYFLSFINFQDSTHQTALAYASPQEATFLRKYKAN